MGKQNIVYIGPKKVKRDKITGSRLVFPRFQPIEVPDEVAAVLLEFETVFVEPSRMDEIIKEKEDMEKLDKVRKEKSDEEKNQIIKENSMVVLIDGKDTDLSKLTHPKLSTLIESHDLKIDPIGSQEEIADFRLRVRNAFQAKAD